MDRKAMGERFVHEHGSALWASAVKHVGPEAAEDLVQETLLAALRGHERFEGRSAERSWLIGILNHKVTDHFRKRAREKPRAERAARAADFTDSGEWAAPPRKWGDRDEVEAIALAKCLEELPHNLRDAVELREVRGVSSDGVCQALGISATNLWQRLHRARLALRRCIEDAAEMRRGSE